MSSTSGEVALLGPAQIRELANTLDLTPTKRRGQNFVIDPNTVRRIVRLANITDADQVLEVGPGLGSLTLGLLEQAASVTAIEIDQRLAEQLPRTVQMYASGYADRLTVIADDALQTGLPPKDLPPPTALVANLPYNVAVPVLLRVLTEVPSIQRGLVMVQKEVADRLVAGPGSRVYGVPSVKLAWFGHAKPVGNVPPGVFWPAPHVDSGLVEFVVSPASDDAQLRDAVFATVDAAFSQRRKTLRSALADWAGGKDQVDEICRRAGIDSAQRGEALTLSEFAALATARTEQGHL